MDKKNISKIKHLSLRSKSKKDISQDIIEDNVQIQDADLKDSVEVQGEAKSEDFFSQTINFKTSKSDSEVKLDKAIESDSNDINYSTVQKDGISSTFYSSQKFVKEVSRVFKKTMFILILDIIAFSSFVFAATNLFNNSGIQIGAITVLALFVVSVSVTAFFYVLLSERKYLYINIILKCVIYFAINSFIGQGISLITLIGVILIFLFSFLSYLELEKMQLGSRLFNLSIIAGEAKKILVTLGIIIISFGVFNQIIFQGTQDGEFVNAENFVNNSILSNDNFVETALIGTSSSFRNYNLNSFLISRNLYFSGGLLQNRSFDTFLFKDYLALVYDEPSVISNDEEELFEDECSAQGIEDCNAYINDIYNTRLVSFRETNYPDQVEVDLNSTIDLNLYKELTKRYYLNLIKDSSRDVNTNNTTLSFINNLPFTNLFSAKYLIPIVIVVVIFIVLSIFRFIISFLTSIVLSIIWNVMRLFRFVRVEIENVESEVVSI